MKSMNDLEKVQKINLYPMKQGNMMQRKEKIRSNKVFSFGCTVSESREGRSRKFDLVWSVSHIYAKLK